MEEFAVIKEFKYVKPIHDIAKYIGLIPNFEKPIWCKIYGLIYLLIMNAAIVYSLYVRLQSLGIMKAEMLFLSATTTILSGFFGNSVIMHPIHKFKKAQKFYKLLYNLPSLKRKNTFWTIRKQLILTHMWYFSFIVSICQHTSTLNNYKNYFSRLAMVHLNIYLMTILSLLLFNHVLLLKRQFAYVNSGLENILKLNYRTFESASFLHKNESSARLIIKMRKNYTNLSKVVGMFNGVFGWQILAITLLNFMELLLCINSMLEIDPREVSSSSGILSTLCQTLYWYLNIMSIGIVLSISCDKTTSEARKTSEICYNILVKTPVISTNVQDRILRGELILLAQQATCHCPHFSAAGFFKIDHTLLLGLLGIITSYVIVLIQIN